MVSNHYEVVPCPSVKTICLYGGYGEASEGEEVIRDISLVLESGSFNAIIGPNGSGKSTFLKHLIKELRAKEGSVLLYGNDISAMKQRDVAKLIAFEGQNSTCSGDFTVAQVVALGRYVHGDEGSCSKNVMKAFMICMITKKAHEDFRWRVPTCNACTCNMSGHRCSGLGRTC